jgi:regulator of cell morphogenesis and NO signaling
MFRNDEKYIPDRTIKTTALMKEQADIMLQPVTQSYAPPQELINWDLGSLIDYIIETHHQYVKSTAATIYDMAQKLAYRNSKTQPDLAELVTALFFFLHDFLNHMRREEQILFPNIKQLLKNKNHSKDTYTTFGLIKEWASLMKKEHRSILKGFKVFRELTNNYCAPADASNEHKSLFKLMKEFETRFLHLVNIENNIVFPRSIVEDETGS